MTLVYRVEDEFGHGMYHSNKYLRCSDSMQSKRHPTPTEDAELSAFLKDAEYEDRKELFFGYASIAQLRSWIYSKAWRIEIAGNGFQVSVYDAEFVQVGAAQAVFKKSTAKLIGRMDILDLDAPMVAV